MASLASAGAWAVPLILGVAVVARTAIGLHPYSGMATPPKFGDYEAQRHWMEVTTHLPLGRWYGDWPPENPTAWWGLDYPPLSAFQSWLHGSVVNVLDPPGIALGTSRGHESAWSKAVLRGTVLASDVAIFFPAALAAAATFYPGTGPAATGARLATLVAALLNPAALLIDHGHFQYNCISLGASAAAAAVAARGDHTASALPGVIASILFTAAVHHKQMAAYFAPAFLGHLLGRALQAGRVKGPVAAVGRVAAYGAAVLGTTALCWAPFYVWADDSRGDGWAGLARVLDRLAPLGRGLFEDYVANFWCATHPAAKWKARFSQAALAKAAAGLTLAASAPAALHQALHPSRTGLLYCMAASAFAFFCFSYQVHEKSVLLPLLPITLLAGAEPGLAAWMPALGCFSMWPLLRRDGLGLVYAAALLAWGALMAPAPPAWSKATVQQRAGWAVAGASLLVAAALHAARELLPPPPSLPWLWDGLTVGFAFLHIAAASLYVNWRLWSVPADGESAAGEKQAGGGGGRRRRAPPAKAARSPPPPTPPPQAASPPRRAGPRTRRATVK